MKRIVLLSILISFLFVGCSGGSLLEGDVDLFVCRLLSVVGGLNIDYNEYRQYLDDITVELIQDGEVIKRTSTRDGNYSFDGLGEGEYIVRASVHQNRAVVEGLDTVVLTRIEEYKKYPTLVFDVDYMVEDQYAIDVNSVGVTVDEPPVAVKIVLYELNGREIGTMYEDTITTVGSYSIGLSTCRKGGIVNFATLEIDGEYKGLGFVCCSDSLRNL